MRWTKDTPTERGWYWYNKKHPHIVLISSNLKPVAFGDCYMEEDITKWPGHWAGPIPLPDE